MARRKVHRDSLRVVSGVRVRVEYDRAARDVRLYPDESDLEHSSLLDLLRFWVLTARWVDEVAASHPGWTIDGDPPGGGEPGLDDTEGEPDGEEVDWC